MLRVGSLGNASSELLKEPRTSMDSKVVSLEQKVNPCWSILKGVGTPPPKDSRAFGRLSSNVRGPMSQKRGPLSGLSK